MKPLMIFRSGILNLHRGTMKRTQTFECIRRLRVRILGSLVILTLGILPIFSACQSPCSPCGPCGPRVVGMTVVPCAPKSSCTVKKTCVPSVCEPCGPQLCTACTVDPCNSTVCGLSPLPLPAPCLRIYSLRELFPCQPTFPRLKCQPVCGPKRQVCQPTCGPTRPACQPTCGPTRPACQPVCSSCSRAARKPSRQLQSRSVCQTPCFPVPSCAAVPSCTQCGQLQASGSVILPGTVHPAPRAAKAPEVMNETFPDVNTESAGSLIPETSVSPAEPAEDGSLDVFPEVTSLPKEEKAETPEPAESRPEMDGLEVKEFEAEVVEEASAESVPVKEKKKTPSNQPA